MSEEKPKAGISIDSVSFKRDRDSKVKVYFEVRNLCDSGQSFPIQIDVPYQDGKADQIIVEAQKILIDRLGQIINSQKNLLKLRQSWLNSSS